MYCRRVWCCGLRTCLSLEFKQYRFFSFRGYRKTMPKDPKHALEMKEQRIKLKAKHGDRCKGVPSEFLFNILSNGKRGSPGAFYVFSGNNRYLFNCGEGTQRLAHEHKTKLAKLEHIFFTYKNWENIGGLPGLTLTVQDIGIPEITLHGPPGIDDVYRMTKGFLLTRDIAIRSYDKEVFRDNAMTVQAIHIHGPKVELPEISESLVTDEVEWVDHKRGACDFTQRQKRLKTDDEDDNVAVAYICKLQPKPGQLNLEKCLDAGVPPGPLLGILKNGEDVQLPDGNVVYSKDVTFPDEIGPVFIVIECPTVDFLPNLNNCTEWGKYQPGEMSTQENFPSVVVHFTPSSVVKHPMYQDWMSRFSPSTHHVMLNDSNHELNSIAVHRIQHQLHTLHPKIFPLLKSEYGSSFSNALMRYYLRPPRGKVPNEASNVKPEDFVNEINNESFQKELHEFNKKLESLQLDSRDDIDYPEILFLGTGSSVPSKVRNTSGILINLSHEKSILLDIGEGIFGQLINHFGNDAIDQVLSKIHCVFISHLHADHHLGLIQFLKERHQAFVNIGKPYIKLQLIAPPGMMKWLQAYHHRFEPICHFFDVNLNDKFVEDRSKLPEHIYSDILQMLSLKELRTVPVRHCKHAYGIILVHQNGWKTVYSGDTMPCQSLVDAGMNCDVLIHEATMEDDLEEDAAHKAHSTTSQAITIGQAMKARYTILTHFSQRYAKVPLLNENFSDNVGIAFDNMKVQPRDLPVLPLLHSGLKVMFEEHYTDLENRRTKRQMQRKLKANT